MIAYLTALATSVANRGRKRAKKLARTAALIVMATVFGSVALGFATAGAYMILRRAYEPTVVVFIIGAVYAACAILIALYVILGGHEVARAAHAESPQADAAMSAVSGTVPDNGTERDRIAAVTAQLVRGLKPTHLLALSFLAGLIASQRRNKQD